MSGDLGRANGDLLTYFLPRLLDERGSSSSNVKAIKSAVPAAAAAAVGSSSPEPAFRLWGLRQSRVDLCLGRSTFFLPSQVICTYQQSPCGQG